MNKNDLLTRTQEEITTNVNIAFRSLLSSNKLVKQGLPLSTDLLNEVHKCSRNLHNIAVLLMTLEHAASETGANAPHNTT